MTKDDIILVWDSIVNKLQSLGFDGEEIAVQALSISITLAVGTLGMTRKQFDEYLNKLWRKACEEKKKLDKKPDNKVTIARA